MPMNQPKQILHVELSPAEYEMLEYIKRQFQARTMTEAVRRMIKVMWLKMQDEDENQKSVGYGKNVDGKLKDIY